MKELRGKIFNYIFNVREWGIFVKRLFSLVVIAILSFLIWLFPISLIVAPFYSMTTTKSNVVKIHKDISGKTTIMSLEYGLEDLLDEGLVTNFTGVNLWIDNKYFEQVGQLEMYRIAVYTLENNLARNRGTGGANKYLVQARSEIYADYELPIFTSYSTRLKQAIKNIQKYTKQLEEDNTKQMNDKRAVFIVNSDNLAEVIDKLKQQLQTNIMIKSNFFSDDDKFYRIKGNLIAMQKFLQGIEYDFKNKMIDKSSYKENFVPLLQIIQSAIAQNHIVILESFGHVSKLEKDANIIAQKLGELRDKLRNG
ncbi:DUF2333 family protein [Sulfurospirillum arcachonense]|uniref:DUF2333 family protein n=1 Tax=Sulfurospirillum arcachonense TaxID=57666 RepID=UPI000468C704|nr:DUF2333 family protein [Sulfurospirillum arcachonense]